MTWGSAYLAATLLVFGTSASADPIRADRLSAFAQTCFSPHVTAEMARATIAPTGARLDFFDAQPISAPTPSSTDGRAPTPGTDRRCEVSFDGDHGTAAADMATAGLKAEGIRTQAPLPEGYMANDGTTLIEARYLNPDRIAVVQTGVRAGPNGPETFLSVERLTAAASAQVAR